MKITNIKQQEKNKNRYSIFVDGKYAFSLSSWQFSEENLKVGQQVSDIQLEAYKLETDFGKTYEQTLNWLSIRPRSKWEINQYLNKKTDNQSLRQKIFAKLSEMKLVDDEKFARSWVESRRLTRNYSKLRLQTELRQKRIEENTIKLVLADDDVSDVETIKQLALKKQRRYKDQEKLMAYLARQGFNYGDIKEALTQIEFE